MMGSTTPGTGYAPVNGLNMYYEIHGTAHPTRIPLVLLHGGDTIGTSFGHVLPLYSASATVLPSRCRSRSVIRTS
ncbi:MAG TPA: hypothetical protein VGF86_15980 [Candidatus Tumulicola sp.]|jgi:hypothetical protein